MIIRTTVRPAVFPEDFHRKCSKAEHAVAVQAERDCRRFIPSKRIVSSGKVKGQIITWDGPNTRLFYFGNVYENPQTHVAGYQTADGGWKSHRGRKVKRTTETPTRHKKFQFQSGTEMWFYHAKKANIGRWIRVAEGVISRDARSG